MIKTDVELTERPVVDQVGRNQVVRRKRTDIEDYDVKRRVFRFDGVRELCHAILFVGDERLVPLVDFFGRCFALRGTFGSSQCRGRIGRVAYSCLACGCLRHEVALLRRRRTEERRDDEKQQPTAGDGRYSDEVACSVVNQQNRTACKDHTPVDEVPNELQDVVNGKARDAGRIGHNALRAGKPAFRPKQCNAATQRDQLL